MITKKLNTLKIFYVKIKISSSILSIFEVLIGWLFYKFELVPLRRELDSQS